MALESLKAIFSTLIVAIATFGFGTILLPFLPQKLSSYGRYVCAWVGGLGLFCVVIFVVGLWSFTDSTVGIVIAVGLLGAIVHLWKSRSSIKVIRNGSEKPPLIPLLVVVLVSQWVTGILMAWRTTLQVLKHGCAKE